MKSAAAYSPRSFVVAGSSTWNSHYHYTAANLCSHSIINNSTVDIGSTNAGMELA